MRRRSRLAAGRGVHLAGAALAALWPHAAVACGSCFLGNELTREAYYGTTILMIAVPVLIAVAIGAWLYRAASRHARAAGAPGTEPTRSRQRAGAARGPAPAAPGRS